MYSFWPGAKRTDRMRIFTFRACLIGAVVLLAACSQQVRRPQPAPVVEQSKPRHRACSRRRLRRRRRPKPKPKPAVAKPDTKDTDVTPPPEPQRRRRKASSAARSATTSTRCKAGCVSSSIRPSSSRTTTATSPSTSRAASISKATTPHCPSHECKALTPIAKALIEYKMTRIVADVSATGADEAALKSAQDARGGDHAMPGRCRRRRAATEFAASRHVVGRAAHGAAHRTHRQIEN